MPWTGSTLSKASARLREDAGIKDLRFHDLRRSMSSTAQERGHSQAAVREVGGCLDPTVMRRHYSHASAEAKRRVAEDMEQALFGQVGRQVGSSPEQPTIIVEEDYGRSRI